MKNKKQYTYKELILKAKQSNNRQRRHQIKLHAKQDFPNRWELFWR